MLKWIARISGLCMPVAALVILVDVVTRNLGYQLPEMGSTRLQELEWHLHGVLIVLWIGYINAIDGHIRIDVISSAVPRPVARILDIVGTLLLALPYSTFLLYNTYQFAIRSYLQGEMSVSPSGLPHLWIIKFIFLAGIALLWISVIKRAFQLIRGGQA